MARLDADLWRDAIDTHAGFDRASRASLIVYARALRDAQSRGDSELREALKLKSVERASVDRWLHAEQKRAFDNYRAAARACADRDWTCINAGVGFAAWVVNADKALATLPGDKRAWRLELERFTAVYLDEQLRLAALFPKVSSEIGTFSALEWTGDALPDRNFYLSFDDGPTVGGRNTDDTVAMLSKHGRHAVFFALGANLKKRLANDGKSSVRSLYQGQCMASHGWQHQSHAQWQDWQGSIRDTQVLLRDTFDAQQVLPYFRPPYAQRRADSKTFFAEQSLQVALWNIDSQDWSAKMDAAAMLERVSTLMLIKRRGVLLFHDIHAKAKTTLPMLFSRMGSAVQWGDCREIQPLRK